VVAVPVHDEDDVIGAVRASVPTRVADARARRAWLAIAVLALAVLAVAAAIGAVLARRITRPVATLAATARRLGDSATRRLGDWATRRLGDFTVRPATSGMAELDDVADALAVTAHRIGSTLHRERAFSAAASHQLRTPLTAVKIRLEAATLDPSADRDTAIAQALEEIDRLDRTVTELLALAREHAPPSALDLRNVLDEVEQRWHGTLAASGRPLRIRADHGLPAVAATPEALRRGLDVLLDNAHIHDQGAGDLSARTRAPPSQSTSPTKEPGPPNLTPSYSSGATPTLPARASDSPWHAASSKPTPGDSSPQQAHPASRSSSATSRAVTTNLEMFRPA
jgi:signal transduction histidine kinase